ncbi:MAG TPA: hypothetical protein VM029_22320 [Opitutaceae bacterium]|nr:hypothetical protein [Opitutaceae bacterium]
MKTSRSLAAVFPFLISGALFAQGGSSGAISSVAVGVTPIEPAIVNPVTGTVTSSGSVTATVVQVAPPTVTVTPPTPAGSAALPQVAGETSVTLQGNFGVRAVLPSRITVPVGEQLRISAPNFGALQWRKNSQAIPGATESTLTFASVETADTGAYDAIFTDPVMAGRGTQGLVLGVGPTDRLLNLSTRGNVGPGGDQGLVSGFVVAAGAQPKKLIIRAVGPSLAAFGVTNFLRQPVLRIFDGSGNTYSNGYAYLPVVGGLNYETDLAQSLAKTGAFPVPAGTRDVVLMMPFVPGAYTAQVTSGDGTSGNVLLEIYEVP